MTVDLKSTLTVLTIINLFGQVVVFIDVSIFSSTTWNQTLNINIIKNVTNWIHSQIYKNRSAPETYLLETK